MPAPFEVHSSPIHGRGVYALRPLHKGRRLIEYLGERITPEEADRRYDDDALEIPHTFLFTVDKHTVIDAAVDGNEARYINHSCDPNCEAVDDDGRIFIEVIRSIRPGQELTYDYHLERDGHWRAEWAERYLCRCGAPNCRGTLLFKPKRPGKKRK